MALTTTDRVRILAGLPVLDADETAQLDACRKAAEEFLLQQVGRPLEKARRTEYYNGNGQRVFPLRNRPVWQIHNVWLDHYGFYGAPSGAFDNSTTLLTQGTDYVLEQDLHTPDSSGYLSKSGNLVRQRTVWAEMARNYVPGRVATEAGPNWGNIKVDYTAGYDPVPDDLVLAVTMLTSLFKRLAPHGQPLESERIGSYSYSILTGRMMQQTHPVMGSVDRIINRYREVPI